MADKDFIERDALKAEFPEVSILICLFHVLRTFRREITTEKQGITAAERSL
jgi:zinc finger SWIM domain-containing protein 3